MSGVRGGQGTWAAFQHAEWGGNHTSFHYPHWGHAPGLQPLTSGPGQGQPPPGPAPLPPAEFHSGATSEASGSGCLAPGGAGGQGGHREAAPEPWGQSLERSPA